MMYLVSVRDSRAQIKEILLLVHVLVWTKEFKTSLVGNKKCCN